MKSSKPFAGGFAALALAAVSQPALANEDPAGTAHSVQVFAEQEDYSDGLGTLKSVTLEYKLVDEDMTVVFTPAIGERSTSTSSDTAFGAGAAVFFKLSDKVSTRTYVAAAEDEPVFANRQIAQDFTFATSGNTTLTVGGRWARYNGDRDVYFVSGTGRYYFDGGSVSYRLTYVDPEGRDGFLAHLVNLSINDKSGRGKTQLWLGAGSSALDRAQAQVGFSGEDYSATLRRLQPLTKEFSIIGQAGVTSYETPAGRITSTNFGVGLQLDFGR